MWNEVQVAFPGLGIDTFTLNKVAFSLFGLEVRWYGILITLGMVAAFCYATYRAKQEGFTVDNIIDMGLFAVIFGLVGARLYYVFMRPDLYFRADRTLWENLGEIVNIRGGGLAIYGGIIAGALTILVYCRLTKRDWRRALDMIAPGVMLAQAMGRWGNFFNGEAHGGIVPEGHPLYFLRMGLYPNDLHTPDMAFVHPTFLYESLWNLIGFALINLFLYKRKKFNGQIVLTYAAWYGFGRMLVEGLREDSLYIGSIRVSQLVGAVCFVAGSAALVLLLCRVRKQQKQGTYTPVFPVVPEAIEEKKQADAKEKEQDDGKAD